LKFGLNYGKYFREGSMEAGSLKKEVGKTGRSLEALSGRTSWEARTQCR